MSWLPSSLWGWWSWLFRFILVPGLIAGPTIFVTYWFGSHEGKTGYWLEGKKPDLTAAAAIWALFVSMVNGAISHSWQQKREKSERERNNLLRLLGWIRDVVGHKARRFADHLESLPANCSAEEVFNGITQPKTQIKHLVDSIAGYYRQEQRPNEHIEVLIMRWHSGSDVPDFWEHYPDISKPTVRPEEFRNHSTIAGKARLDDELIVVEHLSKDDRFRHLGPGAKKDGSMFALPVKDDSAAKVVFVINVVSSVDGRFTEDGKTEEIVIPMQHFADRLILENRLAILKERAGAGGGATA